MENKDLKQSCLEPSGVLRLETGLGGKARAGAAGQQHLGSIFLGCTDISGEPVIRPHSPGLCPQKSPLWDGVSEPRGTSCFLKPMQPLSLRLNFVCQKHAATAPPAM